MKAWLAVCGNLSFAFYAHERQILPDMTQNDCACREHQYLIHTLGFIMRGKHIEKISSHILVSSALSTNCTHTHQHNIKQGFFRILTAYCSQWFTVHRKETDWPTCQRREEGGCSQKGSSVTKYSIWIHHEQFIGGALEQHYGCIRGKPQAQWEDTTVLFPYLNLYHY